MHQQQGKTVVLNAASAVIPDTSPIGRQVLNLFGLHPVTNYMLIQWLPNGALEEIDLDEAIKLNDDGSTEFFAFETDRLYYFVLNDRRSPWKQEISEAELQKLANAQEPVDVWLSLEAEKDRKIQPGETVSLQGNGVEKFYTKARPVINGPVEIIVNGRPHIVHEHELSYEQVVRLEYPDAVFGETINYSVTYTYPHNGGDYTLIPGSSVIIKKGMVINVFRTDKS